MLFKMIELPSDEPVQYVGVYVLRWGQVGEPTVAFREATPEEISDAGVNAGDLLQGLGSIAKTIDGGEVQKGLEMLNNVIMFLNIHTAKPPAEE